MPQDLELVRKEKFAYLTTSGTKTGKPHSVQVWFSMDAGKLFLSHEGDYTDWMRNIMRNERVRVRIGRLNMEADASILKDGESIEIGNRSLYEKYYGPAPKATIDDWFELSKIIQLTPIIYGSINTT